MADNNQDNYSQYTQGMTAAQAAEFARLADIYNSRFQRTAPTPGMEDADAEDLSLSSYSQDIQDLLSNDRFAEIQKESERQAMIKILSDHNIDVPSFFEQNPGATPLDAMRVANYNGYSDKEKRYKQDTAFTYESGREEALKALNNEYNSTFQNSFLFPEMGGRLNEILPDHIKNDPEKRAQFERAFYYETGGAKIDFDESGRVGDIHTENLVGNMVRGAGYVINDLMSEVVDGALGTANSIYDLFGGDIAEADREFREKQEAGEIETAMQREERLQDEWAWSDPIFWAAFSSPEARRQVYSTNKGVERTIDFQAIMDRGGITEATAGQLWGAGIDQLVQSAPLLLDLAAGSALGKGILKGAAKRAGDRVAAKAGSKAVARGKGFVDPKTKRFISKDAAKAMDYRVDQINKAAARTNNLINQGGAFLVSDALVASQIHADNVGQEWYDNLSQGERFTYLGIQAGAEVASGMVLSNIFARGFGPGKMTQNIFSGQKNAMREYSKNVVRSVLLGAGEEVVAEGATAGVQYWNEIRARIQGGDQTAYYDPKELNKRIIEGATAGLLMGGLAGGFSGAVGGAAKASLANYGAKVVEAKKKQQEATKALDKAVTQTAKKDAMRRLEQATKEYTASQTAMARAYNRMAQSDSETFEEIARMQGMINMKVHQHNTSTDPEFQGAIFQEIKALVEKKQELETEAAKAAGVENLDGLYKEEFDKINKERTNKEKEHRVKMESDPEIIAQRELEGQMQAQKDAFDAAEAANSPDQNADDDVQDKEGETAEDAQAKREAAQDNSVKGDADNEFAPNIDDDADVDDRVKSKYRDVIGTVNNLMKGFKKFGIKVVLHKTSDSYFKATGKTGRGVFFRDNSSKTIHMDLEKMALGREAKGLEGVYDTPTHEFLHLAFTTADVATLRRYKAELLGLARRVGLETEAKKIFSAVEDAYKGKPEGDMINEQVTNALERLINALPEAKKPGFIEGALRAFLRVFGLEKAIMGEQVTNTDFLNFIKEFKQARDEGAEFKREEIPVEGAAETESRDLGMRQPSKAYPDLIQKEVFFTFTFPNKYGGVYQYQSSVRVNDYWHFRNWWIKQTGNGKKASNMMGFMYKDAQGNFKTINPPKPKRDRETGEIVDMEPTLKSPDQRKIEQNVRDIEARERVRERDAVTKVLSDAISEIAGVLKRTARDRKTEFFLDQQGREVEERSNLPVVYSERIFIEGLRNLQYENEFESAMRNAMSDFEFLVPKNQEGKFEYSLVDNGDGTVTLEVHSDVLVVEGKEQGQVLAEGTSNPQEGLESIVLKISKSNSLGKEEVRGNIISDTAGKLAVSLGFDKTGDFSGVRELISRAGEIITSHIDRAKARMIYKQLVDMALQEAQEKGMKPGDIGEIVIYHTLLEKESTLGNPYVFSEIMKKFADRKEMENSFNKSTGDAKIVRNAIEKIHTSADPDLDKFFDDIEEGKKIEVDDVLAKKIVDLLADNLNSFDFSTRTKIAKELTSKESRDSIYKKYNDSVWDNTPIGNVVAYTVLPFKYDPSSDKSIKGFKVGTESNRKNPFRGLIQPEPIFGADGKLVEKPKTLIPTELYHLAELMPGTVTKVDKKGDKEQVTERVSDLPVSQQITELNPRAAISAVKGRVQPTSFLDPDNSTRGLESVELGLNTDNESSLPFEPNRLNSFQAFMARVDQLFANKYANVFSLQKAIEGAKKAVVDISQDFINAETLMYGKTANDLEKLDEKVKVISQEMKEAGLIGEDVSQYLIARHAEERNALIAERTEGKTVDGSGMSNERAQEVLNSFSPERKAALESIAKKVDAITKDTRKTMVKFGLESQETIDAFEEMFDNYVPLGGLSVDEMSADTSLYPTGGAGMSIYGDTTRRARGRKTEANNVLAQAIAQNAAVHAKARKNEALSSLYNLVEANPNAKVWKISNEVPFDAQSAVGVRVNGEQKFIVFTNADHAKALKNMGVEKLDLFSKVMRSFSGFLRRSFTTANPEFIISNFARDIQSALFNAMAEADIPGGQIQSKYIATKIIERVKQTLPALLKGAVGKDLDPEMAAYFEEFKEDGGQTGWGFVKDVGTIAAEIEAEVNEKNKAQKAREWMMKNSIDVVENVNDAFENSIRLAAYMEARKAGASREKAAELAKNITVNFNRSGELGAVANAWYMFFNASVQGTVRLARSLGTLKDVRKPNGELESWHNRLNAAQKMAFGLSLTTGMLTAINLAMSDEDEDGVLFYNKIPDYEKERNLIIMYDGKNYIKIPLPYGFNVFANMGSAMAEVAGGQRDMTDAGMFILNSAFSSFSPISFGQSKDAAKYLAKGATPTIFKPLVDIAVNESYFGSSVYKEQFPVGAPKPEAEMSFRSPEGVRKFFQWMNEATGGSEFVPGKADFNPDKFWYGFEYYIGGAGQFVTRTIGTGRDTYEMIKEGEKVPMKANDFPFLRKLYGEFSKYYDSDVYVENSNLVSQLYKERKEAENKNDKRYKGIMKLESERKKTEKQIKRLRELRKEARDIENYVDRQNRIYELYEKERSLLMQFNKQFEKLRGQD